MVSSEPSSSSFLAANNHLASAPHPSLPPSPMADPVVTAWSPYPPSQTIRDDISRPPLSQVSTSTTISSDGTANPTLRRPPMAGRNTSSSSYKSDSIIDNFRSSLDMVVSAPVGAMSISPAARESVQCRPSSPARPRAHHSSDVPSRSL